MMFKRYDRDPELSIAHAPVAVGAQREKMTPIPHLRIA
jgi:hypothetical protein